MSVTALDDLTIHQGYGTINQVESGDPRWFESYWFHVGLPVDDISIAGHLGSYPVANTMDAAAAVSVAGHQFNVRAARTLERDRTDMSVGPLRAEILEPYRRWRFVLEDDADSGLAFDLEFVSDHYPMEVATPIQHRREGRHTTWDMWHYAQTGVVGGTLVVEGETRTLASDQAIGVRDRSWGVRPIFGQIPHKAPVPDSIAASSTWLAARFPANDLWLWLMEPVNPLPVRTFGSLSDDSGRVRLDGCVAGELTDSAQRLPRFFEAGFDLEYQDGSRLVSGGHVASRDTDGRRWQLDVRPISTIYSKGLGFGNPDFLHVQHKGDVVQRDDYCLGQADVVAGLVDNPAGHLNPFGIEQFCEFTGNGERGYGVIRTSI